MVTEESKIKYNMTSKTETLFSEKTLNGQWTQWKWYQVKQETTNIIEFSDLLLIGFKHKQQYQIGVHSTYNY